MAKNMTDIEAKINSKLQEIESMFQDRNIPGAPVIIKGNNSGAMLHGIQNSMDSMEGAGFAENEDIKKGPANKKTAVKGGTA